MRACRLTIDHCLYASYLNFPGETSGSVIERVGWIMLSYSLAACSYRSPLILIIEKVDYYTESFGFNPLNIPRIYLFHHAKTQSRTASPPRAAKATLDLAVTPAAAPPVVDDDSAAEALSEVDEAPSPPVALASSEDPVPEEEEEELSATATVEVELTTPVLLPCESVAVLTTSTVELPVTVAYAAVESPNMNPALPALTRTPPTRASGPPTVRTWPAICAVPPMAVAV